MPRRLNELGLVISNNNIKIGLDAFGDTCPSLGTFIGREGLARGAGESVAEPGGGSHARCRKTFRLFPASGEGPAGLLVQDECQQRLVDLDPAVVVFDEAEFSKFVHEEIDARARRADDFRQSLLGNVRQFTVWLVLRFSIAAEHEQRPSQAFLTGIEELIDQIFLDSIVVTEHILDKIVG